jgi:hypothetical protein
LTLGAQSATELAAAVKTSGELVQERLRTGHQHASRAISSHLNDITVAQPGLTERPDRDRDLVLAGYARPPADARTFLYAVRHQ